jgi:hypothetical protein
MTNLLSFLDWKIWFVIIFVIFVIFWLVYGGNRDIEVIGLNPLFMPTAPNSSQVPPPVYDIVNRSNARPKEIDLEKNEKFNLDIGKSSNKRSKSERIASEVFETIIKEFNGNIENIKHNIRLPHIKNPKTNRSLEFDCYYEEGPIKIALEADGIQHSKFPNLFHPDTPEGKKKFEDQIERDKVKDEQANKYDICLIRVPAIVDNYELKNGVHVYNSKLKSPQRRHKLYPYIRERVQQCLDKFEPKNLN